MAMIGIQANNDLNRIAESISTWQETTYVVISAGSFDLLIEVVCTDNNDLLRLVERLRTDFDKMMEIFDGLSEEDWTGLIVSHFYMGPLPAFFYPAFQLMDYGVHSWDLRQGTGRAHGLSGDAADLLVPFMFVLWKYTTAGDSPRSDIGIRITSGPNAGDTRVTVGPDGMSYEPADVSDLDTVLEFDPGSFVLTAFGRSNSGTIRGDRARADRYLNLFFRI